MIAAIGTRRLIIFIPARGKSSTAQIPSRVQLKYEPIRRPAATCLRIQQIQQRAEALSFMFFAQSISVTPNRSRKLSPQPPPLGQGLQSTGKPNGAITSVDSRFRYVGDSDPTVHCDPKPAAGM